MADTTYYVTADNHISASLPDNNFGNSTSGLIAGQDAGGNLFRTLLKFDISAITHANTIRAAKLRMYANQVDSAPASEAASSAYKLIDPGWTEMGSTYNKYDGSNNWPGGAGAFGDVEPSLRVQFAAPVVAGAWKEAAGFGDICRDAVRHVAGIVNLLLRTDAETLDEWFAFRPLDYDSGSVKAELVVTTGSRIRSGRPPLRRSHYLSRHEQRPGGWRPALAGLTDV